MVSYCEGVEHVMVRRASQTAVYTSKNPAVSTRIAEPFPGMEGERLSFQIRLSSEFCGRIRIKESGSVIIIECHDEASKNAFLSSLEEVLCARNLDERRWTQDDDS